MNDILFFLATHLSDAVSISLMMTGLYLCITDAHLIRKLIGLSMFQTAVLLFYVSSGWLEGGASPILNAGVTRYANPLPQVLMLTAIVVGVATLAVGLALAVRIQKAYGTMDDTSLIEADRTTAETPLPRPRKPKAKR